MEESQTITTLPPVYLLNSLGNQKEKLIVGDDRVIRWYNCGPTVYDSSHMGHARSYISLDIIRRILSFVFKYKVVYCMNITDIDDKIIKRARQQYLFDNFEAGVKKEGLQSRKDVISQAVEFYKEKMSTETDPEKIKMMKNCLDNCDPGIDDQVVAGDFLAKFKDILVEYLDYKEGSKITDNRIFSSLPKKYEKEFLEDMRDLNILDPDILTRVSEFVPQIVKFIEKVIDNGYAYQSNGSVYFDTVEFNKTGKHRYGKLLPEAIGDVKALSEGEGVYSSDSGKEKKHPNDFALWKKSKAGEPSWESPWGSGRPGWHIECSVMASEALGSPIHLHSGGIDLKFPHHENEIAQSEAFYDTGEDWIKYWIHTGHLTISGCKMSKSLKNFITIKECLKLYSCRQLRLAFLLHSWSDTLDYSVETMKEALSFEEKLDEFYMSIRACLRENSYNSDSTKEEELIEKLVTTKEDVLKHLADNFNTKSAMKSLLNLIGLVNNHLQDYWSVKNESYLQQIFGYVAKILGDLGAWEEETDGDKAREAELFTVAKEIRDKRFKLKNLWKESKDNSYLKKSDQERIIGWEQGIILEDKEVEGEMRCKIKIPTKKMFDRRLSKQKADDATKLEKERKMRELQEAKNSTRKIPPSQMFLNQPDKYSLYDEKGIPTHDHEGEPIAKSQLKKLMKLYAQQEKKYNDYLKGNN